MSTKILAVYVGPVGFAIIGNFSNLAAFASSAAGGLIQGGIVKLVAEVKDESERRSVIFTCLILTITLAAGTAGALVLLQTQIAAMILGSADWSVLCAILAIILMFGAINSSLQSIQNGRREIGSIVAANVGAAPLALLLLYMLASRYGIAGAAIASVIGGAIALPITLILAIRRGWLGKALRSGHYTAIYGRRLVAFALMASTSAVCVPLTQFLVRRTVTLEMSLNDAGIWQGMWRLSEVHISLYASILTYYFLPRYAECSDSASLRHEVLKGFRVIVPLAIMSAAIVATLRDYLIPLIFTNEFLAMRNALLIQLAGDAAKVASWVLGFVLVAKVMTLHFVILEILFSILFVVVAALLVPTLGISGAASAYLVTYLIFVGTLVLVLKRRLSEPSAAARQ